MRLDKTSKTLLLVITILLTIILVKPLFEVRSSYAQRKTAYKIVSLNRSWNSTQIESEFNKHGTQGWEFVQYFGAGWAVFKK